jgi:tRNA pseudouridine38-40 synthase
MVSGDRSGGESREKRIALKIQYDGTGFCGWQIQDSGRTVQGELERSIRVLLRNDIRVTASGRTDSGVHSLGQVIHFDFSGEVDLRRLCIGLNGILHPDISVINAYSVPSGFHARFSAVTREYLYLIYNHPLRSPFIRFRAMWVKDTLDINFLREASLYLIGEKDFSSFCKKVSAGGNNMRRLDEFEVTAWNDLIIFRIRGNAFLHNMIRIIVGTMVDMHHQGRRPEHILEILKYADREMSGKTAPPYGLYLNSVEYDPPLETMESAYPHY